MTVKNLGATAARALAGHVAEAVLHAAGEVAIDTLACEGDGLAELGEGLVRAGGDDGVGNLDAHLVVLVAGLRAGVLGVRAATVAAAVIEDHDHGGAAGLVVLGGSRVGLEEGGSHGSSGASLNNLAAASLHGHHGGEGGGSASEGEYSSGAADHRGVTGLKTLGLLQSFNVGETRSISGGRKCLRHFVRNVCVF